MMIETENDIRELICELCRQFYSSGWVTGTGGSISIRLGEAIFMTPSGVQKERIKPDEIFILDRNGTIISTPLPKSNFVPKLSDCSPLFLHAFRQRNAGAVLHSHAICCNLITAMFDGKSEFRLSHQEMIKGIKGFGYRDELVVPIIENTAHEHELADSLGEAIAAYPQSCAVLVRRHGMYVWGDTWEQAKRHGECLHYLFEVCISMQKLGMDYTLPAISMIALKQLDGSLKRPVDDSNNHSNGHSTDHLSKRLAIDKTLHVSQPPLKHKFFVFDIEGTTTPITFVKDVLFPYAAQNVKQFLTKTWHTNETKADIAALYLQAYKDAKSTVEPQYLESPLSPDIEKWSIEEQVEWLTNYVSWNISLDRKIGPLKQLQGHIWRHGYQSGVIRSDLFPDIPNVFERIVESGGKIAIYSSGSREAQKLLFKYSVYGDLSNCISCYFDTQIGAKRETKSYEEITLSLGADSPSDILFLTDIIEEAQAARSAGLDVILSVRPGNAPLPEKHDFPEFHFFAKIV